MNAANLQLEGLIMAVAAIGEAIEKRGMITHEERGTALSMAESAVARKESDELSLSHQAAAKLQNRILLLANQASQQGRDYTFSQYAELLERLTLESGI
jgi:hypothetical protein